MRIAPTAMSKLQHRAAARRGHSLTSCRSGQVVDCAEYINPAEVWPGSVVPGSSLSSRLGSSHRACWLFITIVSDDRL